MSIYLLLLIVLFLSFISQFMVTNTYKKYLNVKNSNHLSGYQVARKILDDNGLFDVEIVESQNGLLSDFYDPKRKIVSLSSENYHGYSISAAAVAAHEVGHAIQHKTKYIGIELRNTILPFAIISSNIYIFVIMISFMLEMYNLVLIGIILYGIVGVFQLITLPVEIDASSRALKILKSKFYFNDDEYKGAKKVLNAAAFTYIAAFLATALNIIRLFLIYNDRRK